MDWHLKLEKAQNILEGIALRTPVLTSSQLNEKIGSEVFVKAENFQRMGAFKFRGAYFAMSQLPTNVAGVVAFSSGNHAQAVALAGRLLGIKAIIVMPQDAPKVKVAATRGYGAEVILYDRYKDDREAIAREIVENKGYVLIPPFDHEDVLSGQGTLALELHAEVPDLDALLVQVGGGGLISGCALATHWKAPGCKVIGVEPELADDATRSFKTQTLHSVTNPPTIADGLMSAHLGDITFPLVLEYVSEMVTVSEEEIIEAIYFYWTRFKVVSEPSGAVPLAALLAGKLPELKGKRVGVVLSGGNADVRLASDWFNRIETL